MGHHRGISNILEKLSKSLEKTDYQRTKYDWCEMKKMFKGKQWTIIWHVDDLNMLHVDSDVVSSILADIDANYGYIAKMTITQAKIHK